MLKSGDITLPTKVCLVKAMVFPVVTYGCESWTIKKAEHQRMLLNCGDGKDLRVPWTARRSNQSILKEISPEYSLEGLMLKLKLQYFGHPMRRTDSFEKTLMLGGIEGGRTRGRQRMRWLDGITDSTWVWVGDRQGGLACCSPGGHKVLDMTERLNWTLENCSWGFPWLCSKRIDCQRMGKKHEFLKVMAQVHKPGYWIALSDTRCDGGSLAHNRNVVGLKNCRI